MDDLHLHTDVKAIPKTDPLRAAFGYLRGDTKRHPVVLDGKRPYGIPNRQGLMSRRIGQNAKIQRYTQPVPVVAKEDKFEDVLKMFADTLAPYLPYAEADRLKGYVDPIDVLYALDDGPTAGEAAKYVAPLSPDAKMGQALHRFQDEPSDEIPVTDEQGRIEGVLSRRAVLELTEKASIRQGRMDTTGESDRLLDDPVTGYMDPAWLEVPPGTLFIEMLPSLKTNDTLYVTDQGRYVGLLNAPYLCRYVQQTAGADDQRAREWFNLPPLEIPEHRQNAWARESQSR